MFEPAGRTLGNECTNDFNQMMWKRVYIQVANNPYVSVYVYNLCVFTTFGSTC